jgi:hypothetical protein
MSLPTYPVFDEYGDALLQQLGSFWYHYFGDRDKLKLLLRGVGHRHGQWYLDFLNAVASLSRLDVEVFRPEDWYLLVLSQADRDSIMNVYDQDGLTYDSGEKYDAPQTTEILFPLPQDVDFFEDLADIKFSLYNRVLYPSKVWTRGLDFDIDFDRKLIRFREDPFQSDYVATRDVYDATGAISDTEVGIWIYKGDFDVDEIYRRFGFAVGIQEESSTFYKDLVNAMWDSFALGSNMEAFEGAISAMLGVPIVLEPTETVEVIRDEVVRKLVITDKHVYEFAPAANAVVAVGDELSAGDAMVDAVQIAELHGYDPDYEFISAMPLGDDFLSGGYFAALTFENQDVDIEYLGQDNDGKTVITFRVQGFPLDVEQFFTDIHERGKQPGQQTLAELLDLRENPVTQPLPGDLPAQINPLEFVLENTMRNNLTLIKVRIGATRSDAPGLGIFQHFRSIVPPHTTFLVYVEITPESDTMDLSESVDESVETFDGILPSDEVIVPTSQAAPGDASFEDVVVRVYRVSEVCK